MLNTGTSSDATDPHRIRLPSCCSIMTTSTPATLQLYHYPNCQAFSDPIADPSAPPGNPRRGLKSTHMQPLTTSKGTPAFASSVCHMRHAARSSKQHATGISQQQPTQQATVSKQHAAESNMQCPATNGKWQATCNTHNCKHRAARTASNMQHTSKRQQATISKHHSVGSKGRKQQATTNKHTATADYAHVECHARQLL